MIRSVEEHSEIFINRYMPSGKAFNAKNFMGTNLRKWCEAMAIEFFRMDSNLFHFIEEMFPDTTDQFISLWERALGLPDDCFDIASTIEKRRLAIRYKLSSLGLQTEADMESFAESLGVPIKVRSGIDHDSTNGYGTELPDITFANANTARFTLVVTFTQTDNSFTYDFAFPFQTEEQGILECVLTNAKQSNYDILFTEA